MLLKEASLTDKSPCDIHQEETRKGSEGGKRLNVALDPKIFFIFFVLKRSVSSSRLIKNESLWDKPMETNFSREESEDSQRWIYKIF